MSKQRLWEPKPQSNQVAEAGFAIWPIWCQCSVHHKYLRAFQKEKGTCHGHGKWSDLHLAASGKPHLAASSSNNSFTNCRGTCRESTLSAICSRIRRWLPSVVGKRYMRQMAPPNTEVQETEALWEQATDPHQVLPQALNGADTLRLLTSHLKRIKHLNKKPTR